MGSRSFSVLKTPFPLDDMNRCVLKTISDRGVCFHLRRYFSAWFLYRIGLMPLRSWKWYMTIFRLMETPQDAKLSPSKEFLLCLKIIYCLKNKSFFFVNSLSWMFWLFVMIFNYPIIRKDLRVRTKRRIKKHFDIGVIKEVFPFENRCVLISTPRRNDNIV